MTVISSKTSLIGCYRNAACSITVVINVMIRRKTISGSMLIGWFACIAVMIKNIKNCLIIADNAILITEGLSVSSK